MTNPDKEYVFALAKFLALKKECHSYMVHEIIGAFGAMANAFDREYLKNGCKAEAEHWRLLLNTFGEKVLTQELKKSAVKVLRSYAGHLKENEQGK